MSPEEKENQFLDLSRSLDSLIGELKKMDVSSIKGDLKKQGDIIQKSLGNIKGSFRKGGKTKDDGNYLVGENGPEIAKLPADSTVIPLDVSDLMDGLKNVSQLKADLDDKVLNYDKSIDRVTTPLGDYNIDLLKSKLEKEIFEDSLMDVSDDGSRAKAVSALEKLQDKIKNSKNEVKEETVENKIGKSAGPSAEEIKAERERLLAEDPEYYSDPKNLQQELDYFESSYNFGPDFSFSKTKSDELIEGTKPPKKEEAKKEEEKEKGDEDKKRKREEKKEEKEPKSGGKLDGLLGKLKGKGTEIAGTTVSKAISFGASKSGLGEKLKGAGEKLGIPSEFIDSKKISSKISSTGGELAKKALAGAGKKEIDETGDTSKKIVEKPELSQPVKQASAPKEEEKTSSKNETKEAPKSEPATTETASSGESSKSKESGSGGEKDKSGGEAGGMGTSNDMKDVKSLLSRIANTLSGPLNISTSEPFRPNSKRI